jgi:hypothetical protein
MERLGQPGANQTGKSFVTPTAQAEDLPDLLSFGSIRIDGITYEHDVVIDQGQMRKRKKKPSKKFRGEFGHTPLSAEEESPGSAGGSSSAPEPAPSR